MLEGAVRSLKRVRGGQLPINKRDRVRVVFFGGGLLRTCGELDFTQNLFLDRDFSLYLEHTHSD